MFFVIYKYYIQLVSYYIYINNKEVIQLSFYIIC